MVKIFWNIIQRNLMMLVLVCGCASNSYAVEFKDMTIIVSSCDKYASLWDPFFGSLFSNWDSLNVGKENGDLPIILIANTKTYASQRVNTLLIPNEKSWADNVLQALEQVKTPYVMLFLDDYWLNKPVDERRLQELYNTMQLEQAAYLQTSVNDLRYQDGRKHPTTPEINYRKKFSQYKVSLQLAIWDTKALRHLLKPGENPWVFEQAGTIRSHGYPQEFLTVSADEPIQYINAAHQGYITTSAIAFAKEHQLKFDPDRPIESGFNWKLWKTSLVHRINKLVAFLRDPGRFYEFIN